MRYQPAERRRNEKCMIKTAQDIHDLIGEYLFSEGDIVRDKCDFTPDFWNLRTGLLGELSQKLVNYRLRLTLTGDFSEEIQNSNAFRDYVCELLARNGPIVLAQRPSLNTHQNAENAG